MPWSSPDSACAGHCRMLAAPVWPLVLSHGQEQPLFPQAQIIAQAIGQAFGVAYQRFLEANSIDPSELTPRQYSRALEDQEQYNAELTHFSRQENCKDVSAALEEWGQCGVPAGTSVLSSPWLPEQLSCSLQSWALSQLAVSLEQPCCGWDTWPTHGSGDRNPSVPSHRSASGSRRERSWASPSWSQVGAPSCPQWSSPT